MPRLFPCWQRGFASRVGNRPGSHPKLPPEPFSLAGVVHMHGKEIKDMRRRVPKMTTDEEAEAFLDQDLSDLDFSQFKPVRFEFERKSAQLNMRIPQPLLDAVKVKANERGIPYTRYIRELMERDVAGR